MAISRAHKEQTVEALKGHIKDAQTVFLFNFSGVSVDDDNQLRRTLRKAGAAHVVAKNTLIKLAIAGTDLEGLGEHLSETTVVTFPGEDFIGVSKILKKFISDQKEKFVFKGGYMEGKLLEKDGLNQLASLASREELISKLMYLLQYPVSSFARVLSAIAEQKDGGTAATTES